MCARVGRTRKALPSLSLSLDVFCRLTKFPLIGAVLPLARSSTPAAPRTIREMPTGAPVESSFKGWNLLGFFLFRR